jgi:hypothetical protein
MFEIEKNSSLDPVQLAGLFARCGWQEEEAEKKLEWMLAASAEWVVCRFDGELIGFGRSCRLGPLKRVLFDVVVDPRFNAVVVKAEILRSLTQEVSGFEEVSVFTGPSGSGTETGSGLGRLGWRMRLPSAPSDAYLGGRSKDPGGSG